ncbi:hypothetical protein HMI55_000792 [Coelomomyces lativittatus]|nr:hypothetical protein HMI55_000792 [Coelomomyces lativittatus]
MTTMNTMNTMSAMNAMNTTRATNGLPPALDETCKSLYVGNLHPKVTDSMLGDIFRTIGEVTHVKIIPDKSLFFI